MSSDPELVAILRKHHGMNYARGVDAWEQWRQGKISIWQYDRELLALGLTRGGPAAEDVTA